jgi:predicted nucleic acid-binding protein
MRSVRPFYSVSINSYMSLKIFLDANVLFTAAHNPSGKDALIMELGAQGHWQTLTSTLAVEEARRNLDIKFPDCLPRLESILSKTRVVSSVSGPTCPIDLPAKDRPIFLTAVKCRATHLLTGDVRHYGPFLNNPSRTAGVSIMTVADFLGN